MEKKEIRRDRSNQYYLDSENYPELQNGRITLVNKEGKDSKDWADTCYYLRFQAYTGKGKGLHKGLEIPLYDENSQVLSIIESLIKLKDKK